MLASRWDGSVCSHRWADGRWGLSPILRPMTAQRFATENFRRDGDRPGADLPHRKELTSPELH